MESCVEFEIAMDFVRTQMELDGASNALIFDDEMDALAQSCVEDGEWSGQLEERDGTVLVIEDGDLSQDIRMEEWGITELVIEDGELSQMAQFEEQNEIRREQEDSHGNSVVQVGKGDEPQPGPSHRPDTPPPVNGLKYDIKEKSRRTYARNAAVDRGYQVKIDEQHHGERLEDIRDGLHEMFDQVLNEARGELAGNDLGRVIIQHEGLHDPIVVPLQPWDDINADMVMETIEKVLNSNKDLSVDDSFDILIGSVDLPKGGARKKITNLKGQTNSCNIKTSIVSIEIDDQLCLARAISVSWAKLNQCTPEEWAEISKTRGKKRNLDLILQHRKVPESFCKKLRTKGRSEQTNFAVAISQLAGVALDRPASLNDLAAFESVLGVRVMVVSARLGNKFITSPSTDDRPCVYVYQVDDDHFHSPRLPVSFAVSIFARSV